MTKHLSHRRRAHGRSRTMRRHQRGGELAGNPPSAWGWGLGTLGNGWTQFTNSLTLQPGQNLETAKSNDIVPVKNINAQNPIQNKVGGRRRRGKRGGNIGAVLNQAIVPGALLFAQQTYGKKSRKRR